MHNTNKLGVTQNMRKKYKQNQKKETKDILSRILAILALVFSIVFGFFSIYLPYWHVDHSLSLMVSGFSLVHQFDSGGITPEKTMCVDLVFTNNGNRHEAVLGARFVLPQRSDLLGGYWSMRFHRINITPFILAPGEIIPVT